MTTWCSTEMRQALDWRIALNGLTILLLSIFIDSRILAFFYLLPIVQVGGGLLVISQFTLYGDVRRGLRPSWIDAAAPETAKPLYEYFLERVGTLVDQVACGSFRSLMRVELVNDGPVTILLDSRKQF